MIMLTHLTVFTMAMKLDIALTTKNMAQPDGKHKHLMDVSIL